MGFAILPNIPILGILIILFNALLFVNTLLSLDLDEEDR